jgi:hypothetical protein
VRFTLDADIFFTGWGPPGGGQTSKSSYIYIETVKSFSRMPDRLEGISGLPLTAGFLVSPPSLNAVDCYAVMYLRYHFLQQMVPEYSQEKVSTDFGNQGR